jgi:glycosyltransferase involved in cell wall biosynthesis
MKILFYIKNLKAGGAERAFIEVINNWKLENDEIKILLGSGHGILLDSVCSANVLEVSDVSKCIINRLFTKIKLGNIFSSAKLLKQSNKFIRDNIGDNYFNSIYDKIPFSGAVKIFTAIKKFKPDIIVSTLVETGHLPVLLAINYNIKNKPIWVAVEQNNTRMRIEDHYTDPVEKKAWSLITKLVYNKCDHLIAVSEGVKDGLSKNFSVDHKKISVIHNPVSMCDSENVLLDKGSNGFILSIGRLHSQKQHDHLIQAYYNISNKIPDIELHIAGSGRLLDNYKKMVNDFGIGHRVKFLGVRNDIYSLLKKARAFVLSSKYEGFPLSLIEAMAFGSPVVSYDCDYGPKEIIVDGKNGRLVDNGNIVALQEAILDVFQNIDKTIRMRDQAKVDVIKYSSCETASKYKNLLTNLYAQKYN